VIQQPQREKKKTDFKKGWSLFSTPFFYYKAKGVDQKNKNKWGGIGYCESRIGWSRSKRRHRRIQPIKISSFFSIAFFKKKYI
jgi:hypothetical protein